LATGGSTGTGGAITGTGGSAGAKGTGGATGTGGSGGAAALPTITSTMFGSFDNAFMITPCQGSGSGFDCPNLPMGSASCPTATWSYGGVTTSDPTGNT